MFEDKRFNNEMGSDNNYIPKDNYGINDNLGNDNLRFTSYSYVPEPEPINRKQKKERNYKWVKYVLIALIIVILVVVALVIFLKVVGSPVKIYEESLDYGYNYLKNYIKELEDNSLDFNIEEDSIKFTGDLSLETNMEALVELNDYSFDYNLGVDVKNEKIEAAIGLNQNNKGIIDLNAYLVDNSLILQSSKIYSKLVSVTDEVDLEFTDVEYKASYSDILDVLGFANDYIKNNMNKDKISKGKENIEINNKNYKVNSNIYALTSNDVQKEYKNIITAMINDDNTLRALSNLMNKTRKETKDYLEELKENDEVIDNLKDLKFKIYTEGLANELRGFSVFYSDIEVFKLTLVDNVLNIEVNYEEYEVNISKKDNNTEVLLYIDQEEVINAHIEVDGDITNIDFLCSILDTSFEGVITIEQKRIGNKRLSTKIDLELNDLVIADEKVNIALNIDNTTQIGDTIAKINTNNIVKLEELTEQDLVLIENNFKDAVDGTIISPLFGVFDEIENTQICTMATDCVCNEGICSCKYVDDEGIENTVTCEEESILIE